MSSYILDLKEIDKTSIAIAGGKAANLGELSGVEGISVPDGFCILTHVYRRIIEGSSVRGLMDQLSTLQAKDRDKIVRLSTEIRKAIEGIRIPKDIIDGIDSFLSKLGENNAYAVRSSATAEDLPTASFAGQQDTYLNVIGKNQILEHISKCWASLFTERAVTYRIQNGFDHSKVSLAVVVQKMVFPQAAGIMFTADPVTSNRKVLSIDASFGLGEALVSGLVNADVYKVREGKVIDKKISTKKLSISALKGGGTMEREIEKDKQDAQTLTDEQILELERTGRRIEKHFGRPQDIEWCLADGKIYIVQSRPITTLFPIPEASDNENHVYVSVGHQQMMTDPMKPLGLSFWLLTTRAPMRVAAGRLFIDVTAWLASPERQNLVDLLGQSDPLIKDALLTIIERGDFIKQLPGEERKESHFKSFKGMTATDIQAQVGDDPTITSDIISECMELLRALKQNIQKKSGQELLEFIETDSLQMHGKLIDQKRLNLIYGAINAALWINEKMKEWLGEVNAADTLSQSLSNNVTSEMGLELMDVADVIRPYAEVVEYLQNTTDDDFLAGLKRLKGGGEAHDSITRYLDKYGMRCAGEIDITRTRWSEKPITLVPLILGNIKSFRPGEGKRRFEQGRREAIEKEKDLLARVRQLPDGEAKAAETKRMIDVIRNFAGYREFPKYYQVSRYFIYKQALMKEAEQLVDSKVIREREDIYYLSFQELRDVVGTRKLDYQVIDRRKEDYRHYEKLTPSRVITSDGEIVVGKYKRENMPAGAIAGLAVSSGVVEGRARVILNMEDADLGENDILVTSFTDPSWTPLFVSIKGLVTEVGGLMTHGAVIAREYGLPGVVGVENATKIIKDGQRIRVNGSEGYVEIL